VRLVLASNNPGKLREIQALAEPLGIEVISARQAGFTDEVEETGSTFAENARLKACTAARALGLPVLADDSGLVVQALGGRPGVYSARYAGPNADDAANNAKLLRELKGVPPHQRRAAFVCHLVCCLPDGRTLEAEGRLEGSIALEPAGEGGFGYDPVFLLPERGLTVAQLRPAEKNAISHRGQALKALMKDLWEFLSSGK